LIYYIYFQNIYSDYILFSSTIYILILLYIIYSKDLYISEVHKLAKGLKTMEKRLKNKIQKGLKLHNYHHLTRIQKEILHLLTEEYKTPVEIANIRNTSLTAVYKTMRILCKKAVYNHVLKKGYKSQCGNQCPPQNQEIRLHAQEFNIKIIDKSNHYDFTRYKNNTIVTDNNTIRLYENSIEIYSGHSFYGSDIDKLTGESFVYWNYFFKKLENDLKITILKDRYSNINLVKHHYSYVNNELAKQCNNENIKIRVFSTKDNKMWFEIDNSFNLNEAETTHKETAKEDMQKVVQATFNDLRDNYASRGFPVPLMSEVATSIKIMVDSQTQTQKEIEALSLILKLLIPKPPQQEQQQEQEHFKPDYVS